MISYNADHKIDPMDVFRIVAMLNEDYIEAGISGLLQVQGYVGNLPSEMSEEDLSTFVTALSVEAIELLQETNWKPWKKPKELNVERLLSEFADILAFLGNIIYIFNTMGISTSDIVQNYISKVELNVRRFTGEIPEYNLLESENGSNS